MLKNFRSDYLIWLYDNSLGKCFFFFSYYENEKTNAEIVLHWSCLVGDGAAWIRTSYTTTCDVNLPSDLFCAIVLTSTGSWSKLWWKVLLLRL